MSSGLRVLLGTARVADLDLRLPVGLGVWQAMPRVGWTVRSPLGWRALLAQPLAASRLDFVVAPSKVLEMPERAAPWLRSVAPAVA